MGVLDLEPRRRERASIHLDQGEMDLALVVRAGAIHRERILGQERDLRALPRELERRRDTGHAGT